MPASEPLPVPVWCAFDDVDEEKGTIYVLPHSQAAHVRGLREKVSPSYRGAWHETGELGSHLDLELREGTHRPGYDEGEEPYRVGDRLARRGQSPAGRARPWHREGLRHVSRNTGRSRHRGRLHPAPQSPARAVVCQGRRGGKARPVREAAGDERRGGRDPDRGAGAHGHADPGSLHGAHAPPVPARPRARRRGPYRRAARGARVPDLDDTESHGPSHVSGVRRWNPVRRRLLRRCDFALFVRSGACSRDDAGRSRPDARRRPHG